MFRTFILFLALSSIAAFQFDSNADITGLFDKLFSSAAIFGDSTSDTGNVFKLTQGTWPISPPNFHGRYCDSFNWADDLRILFKYNYAYGSATTDNNLVNGTAKAGTVLVPGLLQQVDKYLKDPILNWFRDSIVHILWGGANDAVANPALALQPTLIVNSLMKSVTALLNKGAKYLIVFNLVPLQIVPINAALNSPATFIQLTAYVNYLINVNLTSIKAANPNAQIYLFDLHSFITQLYANPPEPVTNTTGYCWAVVGATIPQYCNNPKNYFFVDTFHFSSPVQKKLAAAVGKFFDKDFAPNATNYFYKF